MFISSGEVDSYKMYRLHLLFLLVSVTILGLNISYLGKGILVPAFSQEDEFRCTNGSTVNRPSECPSSDRCPSSPSQTENGLVQCLSRPSTEESPQQNNPSKSAPPSVSSLLQNPFLTNNLESNVTNENTTITVLTDKQIYREGEVVKITIFNNSSGTLRVDNIKSVAIKNLQTGEKSLPSLLSKSKILPPNGSVDLVWNQENTKGKQVSAGNYSSSVSIGSLKANSTFAIVK